MQPRDFGIGQLFWKVPDAVIVADAEAGRIVLWNPAAEELFGYSASEALDLPIEVLVPDHLRTQHRAGLERYRATGHGAAIDSRTPLEFPALRKTGEEFSIELRLSPIDAVGEVTVDGRFVLAMIRDISRRKWAEEERLRLVRTQAAHGEAEAAQRRLGLLAEASSLLAGSLDYEATLQSVARLAVPTLADLCIVDILEVDGAIRRTAAAHVDPVKEELVREMRRRYPPDPNGPQPFLQALRTGRAQLVPEYTDDLLQAVARDAEHRGILRLLNFKSVIAVPLVARERTLGAITMLSADSGRRYGPADLALAVDLAARAALAVDNARLYREAQEAIRSRDDFLSVAAHELRTPVTSLRGYAQLVIRQIDTGAALDPRRVYQALRAIDRQSDKLARLTSQLLDTSRIEAGRLTLDRSPTDIASLVESVATIVGANTSRHSIAVHAATVMAQVDPLRLEQVVTNLLDNAIRYSPEGGPIDVEVSQTSSETVEIAVRDRGSGIPTEHRAGIFDRFYQAHLSSHSSGMGLGLYVSRQIVQLHGGELLAEFPPDGGTRFIVRLPSHPSDPTEQGPPP